MRGQQFCLSRNAAVDRNEFDISWISENLLPGIPILFLPVVLCPLIGPLMWSCSFWEHIDWSIWEKGRISNRFPENRRLKSSITLGCFKCRHQKKRENATLRIDLGDHIMDFARARLTAVMGFYASWLSEVCQLHRLFMERSIRLPEAPHTCSCGTIY